MVGLPRRGEALRDEGSSDHEAPCDRARALVVRRRLVAPDESDIRQFAQEIARLPPPSEIQFHAGARTSKRGGGYAVYKTAMRTGVKDLLGRRHVGSTAVLVG